MKNKILAIAKQMKNFTLLDLSIVFEVEESEIKKIVNEFIKNGQLTLLKNVYYYIENDNISLNHNAGAKQSKYKFAENREQSVLNDFDKYLGATAKQKSLIDKYLKIIAITEGFKGKSLQNVLKEIGNKEPCLKVDYGFLLKQKAKLRRYGPASMVPKGRCNNKVSLIYEKIYKYFKDEYLSPAGKGLRESTIVAFEKYNKLHTKKRIDKCPCEHTFRAKLNKEYTKEDINRIKNEINIKEYHKNAKKKYILTASALSKMTFKKASKIYLREKKELFAEPEFLTMKSLVENHLVPDLQNYKLIDLSKDVLQAFVKNKKKERLKNDDIFESLKMILMITNSFIPNKQKIGKISEFRSLYSRNFIELNALEIENLSYITKRYFYELYPIILLCLNLGLTKSEIIPLTWGCINFDSKKITIDKIYNKGQIIAPRKKSKREIDLPENIATELLKFKRRAKYSFSRLGQNDTILQSVDLNNQFLRLIKEAKIRKIWFSDLRDTYICKLLRENVSFSYICEQLGLEGIMFLKKKYKRIIDEKPAPT